jgi:hypothetical protein
MSLLKDEILNKNPLKSRIQYHKRGNNISGWGRGTNLPKKLL